MLISNPYDGDRRPGTVGLPLPGVEVRARGETGEIEVRGPERVRRATGTGPTPTPSRSPPDGWFRTGDLGELDERRATSC